MSEEEGYKVDWPGVRDRLAFLLYQFATKVIGEEVKVNPLAADSAIRYCLDRRPTMPFDRRAAIEARLARYRLVDERLATERDESDHELKKAATDHCRSRIAA